VGSTGERGRTREQAVSADRVDPPDSKRKRTRERGKLAPTS
jgi:hypothetical protein